METTTISSAVRKKINLAQTRSEATLVPQGEDEISKVLGVDAKAYISAMEILNGEANYTASVVFSVTYLNQNNEINMTTETSTVQGKIEDNTLNSLMEGLFKIEIVDVSIDSASSNEVRVQATMEVCLDVIDYSLIDKYEPTDENVLVKSQNYVVPTKCASGKSTFTIQEEFDCKQTVNNVLLKSCQACIKEITSGTEYFTVEGELYVKAYTCVKDGEDITYKPLFETITFKEEMDAEKINKDCEINACLEIKYDEIRFDIEMAEEGSIVKISVPLMISYIALNNQEVVLPCDAYSLTHKLNLMADTYLFSNVAKKLFKQHIDGSIEIDENMPRIGKVLMITGSNVNITSQTAEDGNVNVEGVLTTNVVYRADDENESIASVQVEIPFLTKFDLDEASTEHDIFVSSSLMDIVVKAKRGKEIDVDADITFNVDCYKNMAESYVKEVVLTEEISHNPYPLEVYLAPSGSTLWDIAKHLNVKEDVIISQNPTLEFPLQTSQTVVYFNER